MRSLNVAPVVPNRRKNELAVRRGAGRKSKKIAEDGWMPIGPRLHAKSTEFGAFSPFRTRQRRMRGESMLMMWLLARPRPDKGPSMEDVLKNFGIFLPPPCLHFDQTPDL